ncbi:MAG: glucose 1-dehydrogenase [Saprospiraceae bacterium]|nr:glucose 1-dehydrogenase [Saprospiraceae bacterium]
MTKKIVVITGGAKGIGLGCAKIFVRDGYQVVLLDLDPTGLQVADSLGKDAFFIQCDVSKEKQVEESIQVGIEQFGEISVLVNNAGIQRYSKVTDTTEEEWDLVMNTNLKSAFLCAKYAIPSMLRNGGGVVINISSVQAFVSQENVAPYATAKTAMLGLSRCIAIDYAPTIRSVAVCPGTIDTPLVRNAFDLSPDPGAVYQECVDMHLLKKIGEPSDVGELVAFLASDKASFFTGQAVRIDGGLGTMIQGSKRS